MKVRTVEIFLVVFGVALVLGISSHVAAQVEEAGARSTLRKDRQFKDNKNVLVKLFYIAMRDKSAEKLKGLIDPRYLEKYGLSDGFATATVPVNNVYNIQASPDRKTLMCHLFKDGKKTGVVVLSVVQRGRGLYIVPPTPPQGESNRITPWLMHGNLDAS